jgi:hypothetical protein
MPGDTEPEPIVHRARIMIVAAANLAAQNTAFEDAGYGPENFSIPLSASGEEPATHYGSSWRGIPETDAAVGGRFGAIEAAGKASGAITSYDDASQMTFAAVLSGLSLIRITEDEI